MCLPSENLAATRAPTTTKCDLCQVFFCGIGVQGRCIAAPLHIQHPHGLSDIGDLIQSADVYECFDSNNVEVDIMLDYLTAQGMTPRHIYRDVCSPTRWQETSTKIDYLDRDAHSVATPRLQAANGTRAIFRHSCRNPWYRSGSRGATEQHM